ncbi:Astacin (Peptidase family M12A) [Dyadobacter sp. SG02]|uniref:M12 family metallopeptidase n=1 Tax=Dyadobacter sp. SG02 TaxID=1855291 RepID=UPI0008C85021|nr:M12 family metallopeptidase [Dyadobacter sp. SG02]SEJ49893.1 Astacin (Peptidase family M12A) [Dyadobacter sp. SG02]
MANPFSDFPTSFIDYARLLPASRFSFDHPNAPAFDQSEIIKITSIMKAKSLLVRTGILLFAAFQITSCREMTPENGVTAAPESGIGRSAAELAYPGETGVHRKGTFRGHEITYSEIDGKAVFEGDIILTPEQLGQGNARTQALIKLSSLWRNGRVPYTIDPSITNKTPVLEAIAELEATTPVRFVERRGQIPGLPNYPVVRSSFVTFKRAKGYSSSIGQVGGEQFITLPVDATKGGVLHEIGHTIGLSHEHTRPDRNVYIKINSANMNEADLPNVGKVPDNGYDPHAYGLFDFGSIMMLDSWAYSKNGLPVMTTVDGKTFTVQRDHLSTNDVNGIINMYANVFVGKPDDIYLADSTTGKMAKYSGHFPGAKKMLFTPERLYITDGSTLFQADTKTARGYGVLMTTPGIKAMAYANDFLYFLQDGYLCKIDIPYNAGKTTMPGQYWLPATAMTYSYGFLFIVSGDILFRVSLNGQNFVSMGAGYKGVTEIAQLNDKVYLIKPDGKLYKINTMTGAATVHTANIFAAGAQLASNGRSLLVTSGNTLYSVPENGVTKAVSNGWSGVTELAVNEFED